MGQDDWLDVVMRSLSFLVIVVLFFSFQFFVNEVSAQMEYASPLADSGSSSYALQAGALGDDGSKGNMGVQVSILTHIEDVLRPDYDHSFWVGDNLADGAFIQFGYTLMTPGHYCLHREASQEASQCQKSESIGAGDARWFWQYWPKINIPSYCYGIGPANSGGTEGSWHTYAMVRNGLGSWNFVLDGREVDKIKGSWTTSRDAAYVIAEVVTTSPSASRSFGPVEFSNLSYYNSNGWHQVDALTATSGCGLSGTNCGVPYSVTMLGPNHILVAATKR